MLELGPQAVTRGVAGRLARLPPDATALLRAAYPMALITGFDEASTAGKTFVPNEIVAAIAARHPDRFLPFAGADIMRGQEALRDFEQWVRIRAFRGLSLRPFMIGLPADDRHYYPFYAKCVELGVPLSIHTSANWTTGAINDLGHPRHLAAVAHGDKR